MLVNNDDYQPAYIQRDPEPCPHCYRHEYKRTNRYLYRCLNPECGRYW